MYQLFENLSQMITQQRDWSWSVVGITYIVITLIFRECMFHPILKNVKNVKKTWNRNIKHHYLGKALLGWALYFGSFLLVVFVWTQPKLFPLSKSNILLLSVALIAYILSLLSHLQAMGVALVQTLLEAEAEKV